MLLTQWIRAFRRTGAGVVTDLSLDLQDETASVTLDLQTDEYLYVAQQMPFNNLYFDLVTPNATGSNVTVELWDGSTWKSAVDLLDGTRSSGAFLGRDGVLQWSPDRDESWQPITDTREEEPAFLLQNDVVLYDQYWMRLSVSVNLDAGTTLNAIDYKFAVDKQLEDLDPEIDNFLTSWEAGKTDWERQLRVGSSHVIQDLKVRGLIVHPGQILRMDDVSWATAYKTLEIIYTRLGEGYEFQQRDAKEQYKHFLNQKRFTFDRNRDALASGGEVSRTVAEGVR